MASGPDDLGGVAAQVRQRLRELVQTVIADSSETDRLRTLALAADAGEDAAWQQLARPPADAVASLHDVTITGSLHPFPRAESNPVRDFTSRVRVVVDDVKQSTDHADRIHELSTAVMTSDDTAQLTALISAFARSPDELAMMTPLFDERNALDSSWVTTATSVTTTTTTGTVSTLACTGTTTTTTFTTFTLTTTTSHLCTLAEAE